MNLLHQRKYYHLPPTNPIPIFTTNKTTPVHKPNPDLFAKTIPIPGPNQPNRSPRKRNHSNPNSHLPHIGRVYEKQFRVLLSPVMNSRSGLLPGDTSLSWRKKKRGGGGWSILIEVNLHTSPRSNRTIGIYSCNPVHGRMGHISY